MALPDGITTFTLNFGPYTDAEGLAALVASGGKLFFVDPSTNRKIRLTHITSGQVIVPDPVSITIASDGTGSVGPIPHTGQAAFSPQGAALRVEWNIASNKPSPGNLTFVVPSGATADFDLLVPADTVPAVAISQPTVASVNGQTGAVVIPGLPPTGGAGGALSGTYPNPGLNVTAVDNAVAGAFADEASATSAAARAASAAVAGAPFPPVTVPSYTATMDGLTVANIYAMWDALIAAHPNELSTVNLGADQSGTYQLRKIVFNGKLGAPNRRRVMLTANIHGHDTAGDPKAPAVVLYEQVKSMLERRSESSGPQSLYRDLVIDLVPIANPWGFDNNSRYNSRGVDINRNFAASGWASSATSGATPASEAETQLLQAMLRGGDYDYLLDLHAWANQGFNRPDQYIYYTNPPADQASNRLAEYSFGYLSEKNGRPIFTESRTDATMMRYGNDNAVPSLSMEFNFFIDGDTPYSSHLMTAFLEAVGSYLASISLLYPLEAVTTAGTLTARTTYDPGEVPAVGEMLTVLGASAFFTDWRDDTPGAAPDGWSTQWGADTWVIHEDATLPSGRKLRISTTGADLRRGLAWDVVQNFADPAAFADIEILVKWRSSASTRPLRPVIRGSGVTGAEYGIFGGVRNGTTVSMGKYVNGVITNDLGGSQVRTITANTSYFSRLRKNAGTVRARNWVAGTTEPTPWLETTDPADVPSPGWAGLHVVNNAVFEVESVSVAVGGATAPMSYDELLPVAVKLGTPAGPVALWTAPA